MKILSFPMLRLTVILWATVCLSACHPNATNQSAEGPKLIASSRAEQGRVGISYHKYQLDNGLTVVLHQDGSDPLVHVDVTYHVGSAREELGKSGFAHFFEHMMFQGSNNVGDDQHIKLITEVGGNMNGTTNSDRTNYYQTVPANHLEKVLWLEADRMGYLLPAVSREKFEIQRETVKNERAQRVDNQPYGLRGELTAQALYPEGHPYSWPVIGYVEDLDRVAVSDLKQFFNQWYGPNNAVLTIGGDIDIEQTLTWVERYFGPISPGPEVPAVDKTLVTLAESRYVTHEDNVHLPLLQVTFPTVHVRHEDEAPLDVLADILGGGKTSLFYKNLVKAGYAVNAGVSHPCQELACQFQLIALANPATTPSLKDLHQIVQQTLAEFERRGVLDDDLKRTQAGIEAGTVFGLQSVAGKVSTLASNQIFHQNPDLVSEDIDRYNAVTAEDVVRVYRTYIKDKARVVLSIVPQGQVALAAADATFTPTVPVVENLVLTPFVPRDNQPDNFDRSIMPGAGSAPEVKIPGFWRQSLANGVDVIGHTSAETPTVTMTISLEGGPLLDPIDKAGLASLTASMMNESTANRSSEAMANELAKLGSSIRFGASGRYTTITVSSLTRHFDATLALLQERLFAPGFDVEEFERLKQRLGQSLLQRNKEPAALASVATTQLLYGADNRVSLPDVGTTTTVAGITLDDVRDFYRRYYTTAKASVVTVGDIPQQDILQKLSFLATWSNTPYEIPGYAQFPVFDEAAVYLVDKPDSPQSVVRLFKRDLAFDATGEHFKTKLMNFPLGGMFNSRINLNLREDKGFTYGASSSFSGGKTLGRFQAGADVKGDKTGAALAEILGEIQGYRLQGITSEELAMLRSAYSQSEALAYETPGSKASFLRRLISYGLSPEYVSEQSRIIQSITPDEINGLAKAHLDVATMQILVVGDKETVMPQLESLGRPVKELKVSL